MMHPAVPKFKVGDEVEFTFFDPDGTGIQPSLFEWKENSTERGLGIIVERSKDFPLPSWDTSIEVRIIHTPPSSLAGFIIGAGALFQEDALRLAQSAQVSPAKTKVTFDDVGGYDEIKKILKEILRPEWNEHAFFTKEKPDPNNPMPICPECFSETTRPVRTIYCTKCEWKTEP